MDSLLDAVRLSLGADVTRITCAQIRQLVGRLTAAGQWQPEDRDILIVLDAGYEAPRIAWLLRDLPVEILGRMRSDRVLRCAAPPRVYQPGEPKPVRLWWPKVDATAADVDRCWQAFLRRFDLGHTFRLLKQTLGWTAPKLRDPDAADRWTWLVLAAHTHCASPGRCPRTCTGPGNAPLPPERLTPARR